MDRDLIQKWFDDNQIKYEQRVINLKTSKINESIFKLVISQEDNDEGLTLSIKGKVFEKWMIYDELYNEAYRLMCEKTGKKYDS